MPDPANRHGALLRRWESLAAVDRLAILDALPDDRRDQLESLLADVARQARPDRQYAHYSAWLGALVEASIAREPPAEGRLPDAVRAALRKAHQQVLEDCGAADRGPGLIDQWRQRLRRMAGAL